MKPCWKPAIVTMLLTVLYVAGTRVMAQLTPRVFSVEQTLFTALALLAAAATAVLVYGVIGLASRRRTFDGASATRPGSIRSP